LRFCVDIMNFLNQSTAGALLLVWSSCLIANDSLPLDINVKDIGSGRLFVNRDGHTLYTYKRDREQPGTSVCIDECAALWPPVIASGEPELVDGWSLIQREDGSTHWAYKEDPVYTYAKDTHPGAIVGEKASAYWEVLYEPIATPPSITITGSILGQILVNQDSRTIYAKSENDCLDLCMQLWKPVEAPWLAHGIRPNWTIKENRQGLPQWAYKGQLLYTYLGDFKAGDISGRGREGGWNAMILQKAPPLPDWVTFQETDIGPVMANPDKMTLYYLLNDWEKILRETCDARCLRDNWKPAIALDNAEPIGNWSIISIEDGSRHWTYLGLPVFTFLKDKIPGDIYGEKFGTGSDIRGGWQAIMRATLIQNL